MQRIDRKGNEREKETGRKKENNERGNKQQKKERGVEREKFGYRVRTKNKTIRR